jgi:enoyl-CoA hydratase/carnithine racemase
MALGAGGAFFLRRLVGKAKALEWLLAARAIHAEEALNFGLVNMVVPHRRLMGEALKMAKKVAEYSHLEIRITKRAVYQSLSSHLKPHSAYISSQMALLCETDYFEKAVESFVKKNSHGK